MTIRIHEVHPILVHVPLVLVPAAFLADFFGRVSGNSEFMNLGKRLMPAAAASGAVTAASGLVAQEAVEVGDAHDLLVTHRNLNAVLVGTTVILAMVRAGKSRPGAGYLLASAAATAGMFYTAYLGGKMVYDHGVGVARAGGVRHGTAPEIRYGSLSDSARVAAHNAAHAVEHSLEHVRNGNIAPALGTASRER